MRNIVPFQSEETAPDQKLNRQIGNFLQKLGTYLVHSNAFKAYSERARAEFWAELIAVMAESDLPHSVWTNLHAIYFCRREFSFFPSAAELTDALRRFSEPLIQAERRAWEERRVKAPYQDVANGLSIRDTSLLEEFRRKQADDFKTLAAARGTTPKEARYSALSLLKSLSIKAYSCLTDVERACDWRPN